jgi:N6-L-threonylcarbamoyladenine synthase
LRDCLPKAKVHGSAYDFSFSGIKSAVLNYINHAEMTGETINTADLSASFQKAVVDVLCEHTILAAGDYQIKEVAMAGGVSANSALRRAMEDACASHGLSLYVPSPVYCTDNAAMIGVAAFHELEKGRLSSWDLNANPGLRLGMR